MNFNRVGNAAVHMERNRQQSWIDSHKVTCEVYQRKICDGDIHPDFFSDIA